MLFIYIFTGPTLDKKGAKKACKKLGWKVTWTSSKSLICTKKGTNYNQNCNNCKTWRLFVWKNGGIDQSSGGKKYGTIAGKSYGGHKPCRGGWNLPQCKKHWHPKRPSPPSKGNNKKVEHFIFCATLLGMPTSYLLPFSIAWDAAVFRRETLNSLDNQLYSYYISLLVDNYSLNHNKFVQ